MGTPDFAGEALKALINSKHQVAAVFTQPDKPKGRGNKLTPPPVKEVALENEIPVFQPQRIRDAESLQILKDIQPDIIVVAAYGKILPREILDLPLYGCVNIHASVLPKYRGAAPIHWAVVNGEKETGITIMQMDTGMDTGDILLVEKIEISASADTGEIFQKLAVTGSSLIIKALEKIEKGELNPIKQEESEATYAPVLTKEDELLEWNMKAEDVFNKIRGMNPWPGVYTFFRGERLKIQKSNLLDIEQLSSAEPGEITDFLPEGIVIAAAKGFVALEVIQPAGKKQMNHKDFINGYKVKKGEVLGK